MLRQLNKTILFLFIHLICLAASAQTFDQNRKTEWNQIPKKYVDFEFANLKFSSDLKLDSTGIIDCSAIVDSILKISKKPFHLSFGKGIYHFAKSISIPDSCKLSGIHPNETKLQFNSTQGNGIEITGTEQKTKFFLDKNYFVNQKYILYPNANKIFSPLTLIRLYWNDTAVMNNSWGFGQAAQILEIKSINQDTLFFDMPLRVNYGVDKKSFFSVLQPKKHVEICCFSIEKAATGAQNHQILLENAAYCHIHDMLSYKSNFAHITLNTGFRNWIQNNFLTESFQYGGGGNGYGVAIQQGSCENIVTGNICKKLRHSFLFQSGANANVLAYNYSTDPFWENTPNNSAGDIAMHGNYPYLNLIEHNIVQNIVLDNSHGLNGPLNTFYRNRAELYGIVFSTNNSDKQNLILNEITNKNFILGNFLIQGKDHFLCANHVKSYSTESCISSLKINSELGPAHFYNQISLSKRGRIGEFNYFNQTSNDAKDRFSSSLSFFGACNEKKVSRVCQPSNESFTIQEGNLFKIRLPFALNTSFNDTLELFVKLFNASKNDFRIIENTLFINGFADTHQYFSVEALKDAEEEGLDSFGILVKDQNMNGIYSARIFIQDNPANSTAHYFSIPSQIENPVKNEIHLPNFHPFVTYCIIDASGKLIQTQKEIESNNIIPLTHFKTGIYFLQFTTQQNLHCTYKLIKTQ